MTQPYLLIKSIRILNYAATATIVSLYKGATGIGTNGTQFGAPAYSIPANSYMDIYPADSRFDSADFLTGLASQAGAVLDIAAEIGIS